jgi:D-proline reductase (dithiol) PrdB
MVRLSDLPDYEAEHLLEKVCVPFPTEPWVTGPPLKERRVVMITTAGLHLAGEKSFDFHDTAYRVIPGDVSAGDMVMTHSSVNFDRTGFQQDLNVAFPIDRLHELAEAGEIGSVADFHYGFMGAGSTPESFEPTAREVAALLKKDAVDAVMLIPI